MAVAAHFIEESSVDLGRDRLLVERYQQGDDSAFEELYRRYFERLGQFCLRRVGDPHVAEELAQEAFLRALQAMPRFSGERRFYPWMTVIAQRLCIDHHRSAARTEPSPEVDAGAIEPDHDRVFAEVDRDHLAVAVERLAPRHREVLHLRESQEWSYQQIAAKLSVPVTTVEALLHRARKALRREFMAVAGYERLASLPVAGGLVAALARVRHRVAERVPELAQILAPAAAGVAAIGVAVIPHVADGSDPAAPAPAVARPADGAAVPPGAPVTVTAPVVVVAAPVASPPRAPAAPAAGDTAPAPPAPTLELGEADVYIGEEGARHAAAQAALMPIHCDLVIVSCGLDPAQLVANLTEDLGLDKLTLGGTP